MKSSLKNFNKYDFLLETLFNETNNNFDAFKIEEKWKQLSREQLLAVLIWIQILKTFTDDNEFLNTLSNVTETIELIELSKREKS